MKRLIDFIKTSCAYTVAMLAAVYLFSVITDFENKGIEFPRFALLLLFGAVISAADFIFRIERLHKAWQVILHYCVLLFAFTAIFTWSGMLGTAANIFSSFFVFTFFYFLIYGAVLLIKHLTRRSAKNSFKEKVHKDSRNKSTYKPRFKDLDK